MECDMTIPHGNRTTAYKKGCRGDECRAENAAYARSWRAKGGHGEGTAGQYDDEKLTEHAVTMDEWAELRGYDRTTRTYAVAS